ncbi:hypothetical protein NMY3_00157 [Candidatus Nitrosocosmicus oleophilus]|uniref:Uncharacterized protein n=1 Tax=Candidatus Nitrosocosmicus oleophilus TaxID=1353260 RepID=A0A654LVW4_9ARCH|nr:hypothetical protein [Candidatus Nitrosocosmicus oleophilus]ALI34371.1 hypothetical protein NMY3_00157 [Candidatus Nitrosocosmicus oleophilus]
MNEHNAENKNYDKIRHLVEVDDDILAVFILVSSQMKELYVAKNSNIDKNYVDSIIVPALGLNMNHIRNDKKYQTDKVMHTTMVNNSTLGRLKWVVLEYENLRILKIYEFEKTVFVLINSNTQLEHTVDNILGYYYELDDVPKSLF